MSYPLISDSDFFKELYNKKEFYDNRITNVKPQRVIKKNNEEILLQNLGPQQQFLKNYISFNTPYDNVLIFHETGVGKTCAAISIAEGFKESIFPTGKQRTIVLIKSKTIENNFKQQLLKQFCTGNTYISQSELNINKTGSLDERNKLQDKINRNINKYYEFITYGKFVNRTIGAKKESGKRVIQGELISNLDNRIIIVDEVHNLSMNERYEALRTVLDNSRNTRVVLLSATPVFDSLRELPEILNLLLPKSKQLPIRGNILKDSDPILEKIVSNGIPLFKLTKRGKIVVKKLSRGLISYLKSDPTTFPEVIDLGEPITNKKGSIKIIKCEMSDFQFRTYLSAKKKDSKKKSESTDLNIAFKNVSDASTFSYPNPDSSSEGLFGKKGFQSAIKTVTTTLKKTAIRTKEEKVMTHTPRPEYKDIFKLKNIGKYSCKFEMMIRNIIESPGPVFVFSQFVSEAGVTIFSIALSENGFVKFDDKTKQGPRFVIIDGSVSSSKRERLLKIFNSPENKQGKRISVLLATPALSEGITLKNVRQIHLIEPPWNMSTIRQVLGRGIRNRSHFDLPENQRNVTIFKYSAVAPDSHSKELTIDTRKYSISEEKDRAIKEVERILKQSAVDCALNKTRNTPKNELKDTAECDYTDCDFKCEGFPKNIPSLKEENLDKTTYFLKLPLSELKFAKNHIKDLFIEDPIWNLSQIITAFKELNVEPLIIYRALSELLLDKESMLDKFGRNGIIIYRGNSYIFNPDTEPEVSSFYSKTKPPRKPVKGNINEFLDTKRTTEQRTIARTKDKQPKIERQIVKLDSEQENISEKQIVENAKFNEKLIQKDIYATPFNRSGKKDGKFRIVDNRGKKGIKDKRKIVSGKECTSFKIGDILEISEAIDLELKSVSKKDLCEELKKLMVQKQLVLR